MTGNADDPDTITDPLVAAAFDSYPPETRRRLLSVRRLIVDGAKSDARIGPLTETLKWGQPAYLPQRPRIGTTVRIDAAKSPAAGYSVFFHCQTTLLATFRQLYPGVFAFDGERALHFANDQPLPRDALRHCVVLALTYHLRRAAR